MQDDKDIVELVQAGDLNAFGILVNKYEETFIRYITRLGVGDPFNQDVLQDAFIKMYRNINSFNTGLKFSSWAYRIVHNECISYYRRENKNLVIDFKDDMFDNVSTDDDLLNDIINKADKSRVVEAIKKIDKKYSEVVLLYYFEGMSYKEISDILKIPTSSVGTRIKRAKGKLKEYLVNIKDI